MPSLLHVRATSGCENARFSPAQSCPRPCSSAPKDGVLDSEVSPAKAQGAWKIITCDLKKKVFT
jgi:hypothetical protein